MIHVFAIHGINNDPLERLTFGGRWEAILRGFDLDVEVAPCPWQSSGYILTDVARLNSPARERIFDDCFDRFCEWYEGVPDDAPAVVLGHSFGGIIAPELVRRGAFMGGLVTIGSPLHHPIYGWPMSKHAPATTVNVAVYNKRDPVCALRRVTRNVGEEWNPVEVSFGSDLVEQHAAELYLSNARFLTAFAQLVGADH